jgi:hypothetical protein
MDIAYHNRWTVAATYEHTTYLQVAGEDGTLV